MTPVIIYVFFGVLLFVALEGLLGIWHLRRTRRYANIERTERLRLQLGDARCRLVAAASSGELKPHTATFRDLYYVQTALMRGTETYPDLSEAFWMSFIKSERKHRSAMLKEANQWTPEVTAIANQTADVIRQIWMHYVPFGTMIKVARYTLISVGLMSYDQLERFCGSALDLALRLTTPRIWLVNHVGFGTDIRIAAEMRQTEQLLRDVSQKAHAA